MPTNADDLNQLINGLLDGVLSDEEQRTLDAAIQADPSIETRLSEMQALRRSLLSGRSVGRLGPDFSKRVVSAARKRAKSLGEEAPVWLQETALPSSERSPRVAVSLESDPVPLSSSMLQRAWKVWIPTLVLATAASLGLYFVGPLPSPPAVQPLLSDRTSLREKEDFGASDRELNELAADRMARGLPPSNLPDLPTPDLPAADLPTFDLLTQNEPRGESSERNASAIAMESTDPAEKTETGELDAVDNPAKAIQRLLNAKGVKNPIFALVANIAMDAVAEQNDALRSLLDDHEILFTEDLNISPEQLDALVESQMVGTLTGGDAAKPIEGVQVFFVRAKAKQVSSFVLALLSQYKDFPKYRLDMSFDPSVIQLMNQLSTIVNHHEGARRLTYQGKGGLGLVSAFPASDREVEYFPNEKRRLSEGRPKLPKLDPGDQTSYLILLVRKMAEESEPQ